MADILLYVASAMIGLWGIAHLFATQGVVAGFGELTVDNRRIITMEWIVEGVALVSIGILVVAIATLVVPGLVSLFTGFRIAFLPFRLSPFVFGLSATLIALGAWL